MQIDLFLFSVNDGLLTVKTVYILLFKSFTIRSQVVIESHNPAREQESSSSLASLCEHDNGTEHLPVCRARDVNGKDKPYGGP